MPNDDGNFILSTEEKEAVIKDEPAIAPYIKRLIGAEEFINGKERWCLWLKDASPSELRESRYIIKGKTKKNTGIIV